MDSKGLSRNTKLFSLASFLVDISSEMIIWVLPFFLSSVLMAPVLVIGLIDALRESVAKFVGVFAGLYADRTGKRKRMIIAGYSVSGIVKAFLLFATHSWQVALIVLFERSGKGIRDPPRDSLIVLSEKKELLGHAFGFRRMVDTFGAILGPLIAAAILALFASEGLRGTYDIIFLVALVPAFLAVVVVLFVRENPAVVQDQGKIILDVLLARNFKRFAAVSFLFALGEFTVAFFLLRASLVVPLVYIPLLGMAFNIFYALSALPVGRLSDRFGAKNILFAGWILFGIVLLGFALFLSFQSIFPLFALFGVFTAIYKVAPGVFLAKTVRHGQYASASGIYYGAIGIATLAANGIAGFLWDMKFESIPAPFLFSGITTVAALVMLAVLVKE